MTKPTKKQIEKWCVALRSGEYAQGNNALQDNNGFCCLGVACDVFIKKEDKRMVNGRLMGMFPGGQYKAPAWLKTVNDDFADKVGCCRPIMSAYRLSVLNDQERLSFNEIADCLEAVFIHEVMG